MITITIKLEEEDDGISTVVSTKKVAPSPSEDVLASVLKTMIALVAGKDITSERAD